MQLQCDFLPQSDGHSGWYELLPPPGAATPLTGTVHADWVVLGAGLTGLAAARRLAELAPDASVALIDAKRVGFGSSGRNSGFMVDLPHDLASHSYTGNRNADRDIIRLCRGAIDYMRDIVQRYDIQCDWDEQGKIHGAVEPHGVRALQEFGTGLDALGEPYRMLDAQEMQEVTGSAFYREGLHAPGAVLVQPAALVRSLSQTLPGNVSLYEDSPVTHIELGNRHEVITAQGRLKTPRLILANNAYASSFSQLQFKGRILPIYTYGSMTRQLTSQELDALGGRESWGLIPADPMGTTVRRLKNGRICIRNSFTYNPQISTGVSTLKRVERVHRQSFEKRFPMLKEVEFEYVWGGALCLSRNNGTFFGELAPGVYSAVCQNGLGLTRGTISGKLIAEHALGIDSELLRIMQQQPKPCRNPPEPFLGLGVRSSLAWRERVAGQER